MLIEVNFAAPYRASVRIKFPNELLRSPRAPNWVALLIKPDDNKPDAASFERAFMYFKGRIGRNRAIGFGMSYASYARNWCTGVIEEGGVPC